MRHRRRQSVERVVIWFLLAVFCLATGSGCSRGRSKVEAVLVEHARAQAKLIRTPRNKRELDGVANGDSDAILISPIRFASALQKIDVSRCPPDFRSAWEQYLSAWQNSGGDTNSLCDVSQPGNGGEDPRFTAWANLKKHLHGATLAGDDF